LEFLAYNPCQFDLGEVYASQHQRQVICLVVDFGRD
jgi:hypothetical protein